MTRRGSVLLFTTFATFAAASLFQNDAQTPFGTPNPTPDSFASSEFDVIIVGGGTAGLVVANRLSSPSTSSGKSLRVGVIEAGHFSPSGDPVIDIPNTNAASIFSHVEDGTLIGNPKYDWNFKSVPQAALDGAVLGYPRYTAFIIVYFRRLIISE